MKSIPFPAHFEAHDLMQLIQLLEWLTDQLYDHYNEETAQRWIDRYAEQHDDQVPLDLSDTLPF